MSSTDTELNEIQALALPQNILKVLKQCKLDTLESVLHISTGDLQTRANLSNADASQIKERVAEKVLSNTPFTSAWELLQDAKNYRKVSTGCPVLDGILEGGFSAKGINEISGESGAGKTQLCLQLALSAQLPTEHGVAYICTEDTFPVKRLHQLITERYKEQMGKVAFFDNVFIEQVRSVQGLMECLSRKVLSLLEKRKIRLLIVDSIAAPLRCEYGKEDAAKRAKVLYAIAESLHALNTRRNVAIVCVNQVTSDFGNSGNEERNVPSLGLSWASIVNTRIMISKVSSCLVKQKVSETGKSTTEPALRLVKIIFSSHLPPTCCRCRITGYGFDAVVS